MDNLYQKWAQWQVQKDFFDRLDKELRERNPVWKVMAEEADRTREISDDR